MKNIDNFLNISCKCSGIGSVPHIDIDKISNLILDKLPDIPYWPQFENIDVRENMMIQYSENLPCLKLDLNEKMIRYDSSGSIEEKLLEFYENYTSSRYEYFKISPNFARGFYNILEKSKNRDNRFIKGQVVGPITFLLSIIGEDGKPIIYNDNLSDAITRGLAMKGVWQAKEIRKIGKIPIISFDEPSLSGFGSAFMALERDMVVSILDKIISTVKEHEDILIGLHCCGNSDWDMLLQSKIDILSFDSYGFSKNFTLYPRSIQKFLGKNGIIAWGAVPTIDYNENVSIETITEKLTNAFDTLEEKGIDRGLLPGRNPSGRSGLR